MATITLLSLQLNAPGNWTDSRGVTYTPDFGDVLQTVSGPRCGMCDGRHLNAISVLACHQNAWNQWQQCEDDAAAERANERALEDRGYWESQAQDDYEARMGVVPFDVAYAIARGER